MLLISEGKSHSVKELPLTPSYVLAECRQSWQGLRLLCSESGPDCWAACYKSMLRPCTWQQLVSGKSPAHAGMTSYNQPCTRKADIASSLCWINRAMSRSTVAYILTCMDIAGDLGSTQCYNEAMTSSCQAGSWIQNVSCPPGSIDSYDI